ncbi:hypothetical protein LAZ67_7001208 [Cordylochernes scorpioides]|uniref:RNA-directed DNA polymerase n=1 Tax=Cordylochernes scorpioides TaxID=51811 RepID=A0ABY6KM35_9ARAC|nr:hypothetical protein LAZ67_7001208 [Cordylochernes scorpioides]
MLTVAYGEATLDRSNVYRWYKMFSEGREDVNDEERAGRPSTSTTDEKINEVEKMILANQGHNWITGDEAWFYGYDVETKAQSSQWKLPHEPRPKKVRQVRSNVKVLLTVFFDCRGVVHHEFLPQGRAVNKEYYLQVMRNLREAIRQKRPDLWKNKNWLLHHDNPTAHTSLLPPYSPELAPCDFFLFPKLKRPMKGRRYATLDEIKTASKEELKKIFKNDFLKCFEDWKNRWHKCMISHGCYFEGDKIAITFDIRYNFKVQRIGQRSTWKFIEKDANWEKCTEEISFQNVHNLSNKINQASNTTDVDRIVMKLTDIISVYDNEFNHPVNRWPDVINNPAPDRWRDLTGTNQDSPPYASVQYKRVQKWDKCGNPITHPLPRLPSTFHIGFTTEPVKVDRMTEDSSMQRMTEVRDDYVADALTNMQTHCEDLVSRLTDAIRRLAVPRAEEALISSFDGSTQQAAFFHTAISRDQLQPASAISRFVIYNNYNNKGGPSTSTSLPPAEDEIATLWFQFEDKNTGTKAKIKCRPHVHSKPNTLSVDWVPVHKKVVNISLTKTVKCKRKQFPCVPACAITIHKAQGGTFTTIVYKYSSKQPQQLVYVAMSRVTSIDGLYIITEKDSPLVFKHGRDGNDSQTTRDIRNEYLRLRGHTLDTITKQAVKFCDDATDAGQLIVTNINCQSLSAHAADIETDTVIPRSDYLVLTETWMRDTCEPTPIKGYECVSRENNRPNSDTNAAGGVAIYHKLSSTSTAEVFQVAITDVTRVIKTKGDMCMTEVTCFAANTSFKFILGAVYIHPGASMQDIGMLLWEGLGPYIHNSQYVPPFVQVDSSIPILLCGDFNKNCGNPITHPLPRLPSTFHIGFTKEPVKVDRMTEDSSMQRMTKVRDDYVAEALTNMQPHCEDLVSRLTDAIRRLAVPRAEEALISSFDGSHATSSLLPYSHLQRSTPASISHFKEPIRTLRHMRASNIKEPRNGTKPVEEFFDIFVQRFEAAFEANGLEEGKRIPIFVSLLDSEMLKLGNDLLFPSTMREQPYELLVQRIKLHLAPRKKVIPQRCRSLKRIQLGNESVSEYLRELRYLAMDCTFGEMLEVMLRDRFVAGIKSESFRINCCRRMTMLPWTGRNRKNEARRGWQNGPSMQRRETICFRCGEKNSHLAPACPHKAKCCSKCKRIGHSSRVCKTGKSLPDCRYVQDEFIYSVQGDTDAKIDLHVDGAYLQVRLSEEAKRVVNINTTKGLFAFKRLPYGVAVAPNKFQRVMHNLFADMSGVACYIDDILVAGKDHRDHEQNLELVFKRLQEKDNRPLMHIFSPQKPIPICAASRIKRWSLKLAAFKYTVEFRKTGDNGNADALSRLPLGSKTTEYLDEDQVLLLRKMSEVPFSFQDVAVETRRDKLLSIVLRNVRENNWQIPKVSQENPLYSYYRIKDELSCEFGCLQWRERVVIPQNEMHLGMVKMKMIARRYFWWTGIDKNIEELARDCRICQ